MRLTVTDVLANDDRAAVFVHGTARRGDRTLDEDGVHVFRLVDGKAVEAWFYYQDQGAYDDFWS